MPRKKRPVSATCNLQGKWELHYVSYFLRVFKKLFNLKKSYIAELLEKEISYEAIQVQFGEEIARIVEYLTGNECLGATSWEPALEEQMSKNAVHPNILKGTNFSSLDPEQRLQLLKILVDLVRELKDEDITEFGKNLKSKSLRFKAVGKDKDENKYWTFGSSRLFREFSKPNSRRFESVCTTPSEWEGFILTLRPSPNKNEKDLHKSLKHVWGKIKDHIQLTQLKMKGHLELSQMAVKEHFELKRQAEAIEAIESDLEKPKMTKLMKMTNNTSKHKNKEKDNTMYPVCNSRAVFQNGFNKTSLLKKKKLKPKTKKHEDDHDKPNKMKENISHKNNNYSMKKDEAVAKRQKFFEDHNAMMADTMFASKEEEEEPPISEELRRKIEMDDPGIDLSIFKPLGKRKCVIEMEERKGKTWYEGDDDASEDELNPEDFFKDKEGPKKKKRKKEKSIPTASPAPIISDPPFLKTAISDRKTYVFSTALANRGAYEVIIKGKFNTIIAYHQAQKWANPYLQRHLHCEPFVPEELKNEPSLYTSDDGSVKSYKSSEDDYVRTKNVTKKKPNKKPRRKFSDASASISSPSSVITNQSSDRNEREVSLTSRNNEHFERESLSSDRGNSDDDEYSSEHRKLRIGNNHVTASDKISNKSKSSTKQWKDTHQLGIEQQLYQEYHRYLYNNNQTLDIQPKSFFPPGHQKYQPFPTGRGRDSVNAKEAKRKSSKPRPSPLNQPTALSASNHIPDELSEDDDEDDDDDEEESAVSENENGKDEVGVLKTDQNIDSSQKETDAEFRASLENIPDQPASPTSSKHSLSDVSLSGREREKQNDQLPDAFNNESPASRNAQQTASVISSTKNNNNITPLRISASTESLSRSPRNSPQLSPFAAYRGRPSTYPAEIVNPKAGTIRSPARFEDAERTLEDETRSSDHCLDVLGNQSSLATGSRPTTLYLGNKASPPQHSLAAAYSNVSEQKPQKATIVQQKSPQVVDMSVIHHSDPSPASLDNLCSPAIPMHQANPSSACKTSSNSPIVISDTVNGNAKAMSPVSPAIGGRSSLMMASSMPSAVSPVIANHIRSSPSFPTQNCSTIQAISSASANCIAQRIPSPLQSGILHSQRMPHHGNQVDPNALASLYRQHSRMTRLPAGMKSGIRGPSPVVEEPTRIPSMIHTQQPRAFQGLPIAMPKEASQLSRVYAQVGQESGRAFHSIAAHTSQDSSRSIHSQQHGLPDNVKPHNTASRNSLLSHVHNSQDQARSFLGMPSSAQDASRSQHGIPRPAQTSPRSHLGLSLSSQDTSRTILGMTQSAQEATRNVLGMSHGNLESSRIHHAGSHSAQDTPRSHHAVPHNAQDLTRSHNALTHAMHEQSRYAAAMPHSFHHSLNRNLHDSPHARGLHDVAHGVRPSMQGHSFQQGVRNLSESPVGKSPPTQSLFHHSHGREFATAAGMKSYPSSSIERKLMEMQQSRLIEHQQQARMLEQQQQQTRKSFSVESLTASSEANDRSKGQCMNGQPQTPSALSRPGYSPSQRTHMFAHYAAYPRGPPAEFFKLPPHVQQMYAARGVLGPYMKFPSF